MFKLLDIWNYSNKKFFQDFGKQTFNYLATYDVDFSIDRRNFKNYYYQKVNSSIIRLSSDFYVIRELKGILGLSTKCSLSGLSLALIKYISEMSVFQLYALTQYSDFNSLYKYLKVDEIEINDMLLDLIRNINCNYKFRRITNSDSMVKANKVTINTDLNDNEKERCAIIASEIINFNRITKILGIGEPVLINDFREFYKSNDLDFSINVSADKNNNVNAYVGENHTDEDVIVGLLLYPNYNNTKNVFMKSYLYTITTVDALSILRYGTVIPSDNDKFDELEQKYAKAKISNKFSKLNNKQIVVNKLNNVKDDKITKNIKKDTPALPLVKAKEEPENDIQGRTEPNIKIDDDTLDTNVKNGTKTKLSAKPQGFAKNRSNTDLTGGNSILG